MAYICDELDIDIESVRQGIGSDSRIGYSFIYPGTGYGGSCFPKDVKAIIHAAREVGVEPLVLDAVNKRNQIQKTRMFNLIVKKYGGDLNGLTFSVWGLAFKPDTDDMREAPSVNLITSIIESGGRVVAFDPVANAVAEQVFARQKRCTIAEDAYAALDDADALLVVTEWKSFRSPDFDAIRNRMRGNVIFDGRNIYDPQVVIAHGLKCQGIGRTSKRKLTIDTGTA